MIRCARCGRENPADAQFCMRCGAALSRVCPNCGAANAMDATFCLQCGTPLAAAATTERRLLSILFADLVGSTALTQRLDPEAMRAIIGQYFDGMRDEITHHGGSVEKFIGDAVMAVFGLPVAHEDDADRALRAAVAMQQRLSDLNARLGADLHIRIGISTGEAIADPAAVPEGQFMVTGEIVNLAARLQAYAPADAIVVDDRTYEATKHLGAYAATVVPEGNEFAGRRYWQFAGMGERQHARRLRSPLVGRDDEMQFLQALARRVMEGRQHHLVTLIGPAGVGKSRLMTEFVKTLETAPLPAAVLRGRCPAYGEGLTYWPLAEMLKQECGIKADDPPATVGAKLQTGVRRICEPVLGADETTGVVTDFAALLGVQLGGSVDALWQDRLQALKTVAETRPVAIREAAVAEESRRGGDVLVQSVRGFLFAKAQLSPLVLIFEDLHWAEQSLLDLLEHPSLRSLNAPILTLCLARPELLEQHPDWGARVRNYTALSLSPLPAARGRTLISELLKGDRVADDVDEAILAKAEGNPLFIEEILQMLIDSGELVQGKRGWERARPSIEIRIPDTINGILVSRLDLLTPLEKHVIQDASIPGRVFWSAATAAIGELSPAEVSAALVRLQERDLVEERPVSSLSGDREYAFKHALIREVAYSMLPKLGRSTRHLRFAQWLEQTASFSGEKFLELLANHFEQAWRYRFETGENDEDLARRAIAALRRAGARAASLRTLPEARRLYERALAILRNATLEDDLTLRAELLTDHVEVVKWIALPNVVIEATGIILELAPQIGRDDLVARAWLNVGFAEYDRNRLEPAEAALTRALELFRGLGDRQGEAETLEMLGGITDYLRGSLHKAHKAYRQALALYQELGNQQGVARTMAWLGRSVLNSGNLAEARTLLSGARAIARAHHERISEGASLTGLAILAHLTGDSPAAVAKYQEAIALWQAVGDHVSEVGARRHLGMHYLRYGRLDEAEAELLGADKIRRQHGAKTNSAGLLRALAEVALARGEVLTAAEHAEQGLALLMPEQDEIAIATHSVTLGKVRAAQGRGEEAEELFRRGLAILEGQEYQIDLALTLLKYGEGMLLLGHDARAREMFANARELFETMGAGYFVDEVDRRQAGITSTVSPP
jgi:class 3 adenylate cyclase/tetratricopeptide (TPR) repeat protein